MSWYFRDPFSNGTGSGVGGSWTKSQGSTGATLTTQDLRGRWNPGTGTGYTGHITAWASELKTIGDTEILGKFQFTTSVDGMIELWTRATETSSFTGATGYALQITRSNFKFSKAVNFSYATIGSTISLSPVTGTDYMVRMTVTGTTTRTLRAKVWLASADEPDAWALDFTNTDAGIAATGNVHVSLNGGGSASGSVDWDVISIGDAGVSDDAGINTYRRLRRNSAYAVSSSSKISVVCPSNRPSSGRRKFSNSTNNPRYGTTSRAYFVPEPPPVDWTSTTTDDAGLTDTSAIVLNKYVTSSNITGLTDSIHSVIGRTKTATDTSGLVDASVISSNRTTSTLDASGITDTGTISTSIKRSTTETSGLRDSATLSLGHRTSATDTTGSVDSKTLTATHATTDNSGRTDTATIAHSIVVSTTDARGSTDTFATASGIHTSTRNTSGSSDAWLTSLHIVRSTTDDAGMVELAAFAVARELAGLDSCGSTDVAAVTTAIPYAVTAVDDSGCSDAVQVARTMRLTEPTGTSDNSQLSVAHVLSRIDAAGTSDDVALSMMLSRIDSAGRTDTTTWDVEYSVRQTDTSGSVDLYDILLSSGIHAADDTGLTDNLSLTTSGGTTQVDDTGLTDEGTFTGSYHLDWLDNVGSTDIETLRRGERDIAFAVAVGTRRWLVSLGSVTAVTAITGRRVRAAVEPRDVTAYPDVERWTVEMGPLHV